MATFKLGDSVTWNKEPYIIVEILGQNESALIENETYGNRRWVLFTELKPRNKRNKYNAAKVFDPIDGTFDSQAEYARWCELKFLQNEGWISDLRRQVSFLLISPNAATDPRVKPVKYVVDFVYTEDGKRVAEEVKGMWTDTARLKAYLFMVKYPHYEYRITGTPL